MFLADVLTDSVIMSFNDPTDSPNLVNVTKIDFLIVVVPEIYNFNDRLAAILFVAVLISFFLNGSFVQHKKKPPQKTPYKYTYKYNNNNTQINNNKNKIIIKNKNNNKKKNSEKTENKQINKTKDRPSHTRSYTHPPTHPDT